MGRLLQLELENFKSYAGTQVIGPFYDFTCIIGPNGAGKSNLMDAISFVLGLQSRQLRSTNLKDLIFYKDNTAQPRRAIVRLLYVLSEGELEGFEGDTTITFARSVTSNGVSVYQFQDQNVTYEYYESILQKLGVLVKVRNFLVFQGDIEAVASKSPVEITKLFEQICGSDVLAEEYDTLMSQKDEAEQQTNFVMQKKKMFLAQNKEVRAQRDEANLYNQRVKNIKDLQSDLICMQLHQVYSAITKHEDTLERHKAELESTVEAEQLNEQEIVDIKKQVADIGKNQSAVEKKMENNQKKLRELSSDLQGLQNKNKLLTKRKKDYEKQIANTEQDREEQQNLISTLQDKIRRTEAQKRQQENALNSFEQEGGVAYTAEQLQEYQRLKQQCMQETLVLQKQRDAVQNQADTIYNQLTSLTSQSSHLTNELTNHETMIKDYQNKLQNMAQLNQRYEEEMNNSTKQRQGDLTRRNSLNAQMNTITQELAGIDQKLSYYGYEKNKARINSKLQESLETMSTLFTGIHGKLVNLCKPIQKKYSLAINIVLNKYLDAIVVDNQETARKCIAYLKENHIASCIFLPLENLLVSDNTAKLRHQLSKKYKLCLDVIEFDAKYRNAILYAIGNTILCDSLEDAQALAFHSGTQESYKIVTLKGHIISKSGAMTGGFTQEHTRDRFQESEIQQLSAQKQKLENHLVSVENELQSINTSSYDHNLRSLQAKIHYNTVDYQMIERKIEEVKQQVGLKQSHLEGLNNNIARLQSELQSFQQTLSNIDAQRKEIEIQIFRDFSRSLRLQNIVEMESVLKDRKMQAMNEIQRLGNELTSLESQLSFEQNKQYDNILKKLAGQLTKIDAELIENNGSIDSMMRREETMLSQIQSFKQQLSTVAHEKESAMQLLKDLLERKNEILQEKSNIRKLVSNEEIFLEKQRHTLHNILTTAKVEQISLPGLEEQEEEEEKEEEKKGDEMEVEEGESEGAGTRVSSIHFSDADNPVVQKDRLAVETVDLSGIKKQLRGMNATEIHRREEEIRDKIEALQKEVSVMQPNLHASQRYDESVVKLKDCQQELDDIREKAKQLTIQFETTRHQRIQSFQACFNHVSKALSQIYKDLTKSSKHPLGGNAYLTLDNTDEPFLGGVRFTAMPPMKRFRDMEQLSGGEKTVAALALLFAIHSFRPAPFFVLDEIDAALDNVNVKKVCNYIAQRCTQLQCLVISLKDIFFEHAHSLVGIAKDQASTSSKAFTLDLTKYPLESAEEASALPDEELH